MPAGAFDTVWINGSVGAGKSTAAAQNYRVGGAKLIVAAGVIESVAELTRSADALGARRMLHVRLTIDPDRAASRLRGRHGEDAAGLGWHERRHPELAQILDWAGFDDEMLIDTTTLTPVEVAREIADVVLAEHCS